MPEQGFVEDIEGHRLRESLYQLHRKLVGLLAIYLCTLPKKPENIGLIQRAILENHGLETTIKLQLTQRLRTKFQTVDEFQSFVKAQNVYATQQLLLKMHEHSKGSRSQISLHHIVEVLGDIVDQGNRLSTDMELLDHVWVICYFIYNLIMKTQSFRTLVLLTQDIPTIIDLPKRFLLIYQKLKDTYLQVLQYEKLEDMIKEYVDLTFNQIKTELRENTMYLKDDLTPPEAYFEQSYNQVPEDQGHLLEPAIA